MIKYSGKFANDGNWSKIIDMKKKLKDESVIPKGEYCYDEKGLCPYWSKRKDKPNQENGYCAFLGRGDWNLNASKKKTLMHQDGTKWSPSEMPFGIGLIWDQCKECSINEYTDEEVAEMMKKGEY